MGLPPLVLMARVSRGAQLAAAAGLPLRGGLALQHTTEGHVLIRKKEKNGRAAEHLCNPSRRQGWTVQNMNGWLGHATGQAAVDQLAAAMPNAKVPLLSGSLFVERMHACWRHQRVLDPFRGGGKWVRTAFKRQGLHRVPNESAGSPDQQCRHAFAGLQLLFTAAGRYAGCHLLQRQTVAAGERRAAAAH